jgi:hypothetical protein
MENYNELIARVTVRKARHRTEHFIISDDYLSNFLWSGSSAKRFALQNKQSLDLQGLLGRAFSSSYWPRSDTREEREHSAIFDEEQRRLFGTYQKNGTVSILYDALLFLCKLGS